MTAIYWPEHPLAGITFPSGIGGFVRSEVHQYDDWGHDLSVGYSWPVDNPDTKLSFYVFPAGEASDADQIQRAVLDIHELHPSAKTLDHSRIVIDRMEGLRVDLLLPAAEPGTGLLPSSVVLFKTDGWFIKVRSTAAIASPRLACGTSAENLMRHLGWPDTRQRLDTALRVVVSRAEKSMAALKQACSVDDAEDADRAGLMRASLENLERGEFLDATERCLEMEEEGRSGTPLVQRALRAYFPTAVTFAGGFGATPETPVIVGKARTDGEFVAACHRYLECVLGPPERGWAAERCSVIVAGDSLLDAVAIRGPLGQSLVLFFKFEFGDAPLESGSSDGMVIGRVDISSSGKASLSLADQIPEGLAGFLIAHLMNHHSQYLVNR